MTRKLLLDLSDDLLVAIDTAVATPSDLELAEAERLRQSAGPADAAGYLSSLGRRPGRSRSAWIRNALTAACKLPRSDPASAMPAHAVAMSVAAAPYPPGHPLCSQGVAAPAAPCVMCGGTGVIDAEHHDGVENCPVCRPWPPIRPVNVNS